MHRVGDGCNVTVYVSVLELDRCSGQYLHVGKCPTEDSAYLREEPVRNRRRLQAVGSGHWAGLATTGRISLALVDSRFGFPTHGAQRQIG